MVMFLEPKLKFHSTKFVMVEKFSYWRLCLKYACKGIYVSPKDLMRMGIHSSYFIWIWKG